MNKNTILYSAACIGALWGVGLFISSGLKAFKTNDRYVKIRGLVEKEVMADCATFTVVHNFAAPTLKELQEHMAEGVDKFKKILIEGGISISNIKINALNLSDRFSSHILGNNSAKISDDLKKYRFQGSRVIQVYTKNVDSVDNIIKSFESMVNKGYFVEVSKPEYFFTQLNNIKAEMLEQAVINAKESALGFARQSKSTVGTIRNADQGTFEILPEYGMQYQESHHKNKRVRVVTHINFYLN